MAYQIQIKRDGVNHVQIFKEQADGSLVNDWNFTLKGDDGLITFRRFINETQFAIINTTGWIRFYDVLDRKLIKEHKLDEVDDMLAIFSLDGSKIYAPFDDKEYNSFLATIDLTTFNISFQDLQKKYRDSVQLRRDGKLLFYKKNTRYIGDDEYTEHQYTVFDPQNGHLQEFKLPKAYLDSFSNKTPTLNIPANTGVSPHYQTVETKDGANGVKLFVFKIMIFDLTTFEIIKTIPVRDFKARELKCHEDDSKNAAQILLTHIAACFMQELDF